MSRFEPVHLPEGRGLNRKASQTLLRHYDRCPRSGFLYQTFKGEASTPELQRGSALHAVIEQSITAAIEADEKTIPPEIVKAIVNEVLADPSYAVPIREQDYLREAAYRWGSTFAFEPETVIALETLFVLDLGGWQVRCKIDYAELLDGGATVAVRDWKSSRALPPFEEIARKRSDGTWSAKQMQLVLYALAVAFGVPVRVEPCAACGGQPTSWFRVDETGELVNGGRTGDIAAATEAYFAAGQQVHYVPCPECGDRGTVEIPEPFGVAGRAQRFDLAFVYPGIEEKSTGGMASRPVSLTRLELEEYRASLEGLLRRLEHSEATGDWPAVASDDACSECPARSLCPIPVELRDFKGEVNTPEQAAEAAERLHRDKALHAARQKELREFAKAHGPIRFGRDMVMDFGFTESERIADKDAMWQAIDRAVQYGEPFRPQEHMKRSSSTPFTARKLTVAELEEQANIGSEGSNGSRDDSEHGRDERYGDAAPF